MTATLSVPIYTVDAFTDHPFAGNPAGVCLLEAPREPEWMQSIAAEMNLSETAFVSPHHGDGFDLRWFTPKVEVALCGHATLASAHVLWESETLAAKDIARFHTQSGILLARRANGGIELDFPAKRVVEEAPPPGLIEALGVKPVWVGRNAFDFFVEVAKEADVRGAQPNQAKLAKIDVRGVIVTSRAANGKGGVDFVSRFFAPASGVAEDPVTGSAHCALAPYWGARLKRTEMTGHQVSARGGIVRVRIEGDRVILGGTAVTVMKGLLL
jgi:predicted PhzF superfamily epimerase YddE/YHI9